MKRILMVCAILMLAPLAAAQNSPAFFPAQGAKDVCPDTPLKITFDKPPTIGSGNIRIYNVADHSLLDTIDVSQKTRKQTIGTLPNYNYYPILINVNEAEIVFPNHLLDYAKSYEVTIDSGALTDFAGFADANAWKFSTKSAPPAAGAAKITVAADGTGDFATVQGALDFIPDGNDTPVTVSIRNGTYSEINCLTHKNKITLEGEDRKKTIIEYANNDHFNNNSGGNPFAATAPAPGSANPRRDGVYRRGMFLAHHVDDLTIRNLTLHNTTPHGGSQAEAIILNGTPDAHAVLKNVDLYSFQDTLQINGQAYIHNCYIEGDVDFMWGTGPCFFDQCHAYSVRGNAYFTQIRNTQRNHGYVYKDCAFDGASGVSGDFLSRIDPSRFAYSEVVLIHCTLSSAVGGPAWRFDGTQKDAPNVHFWEYDSHKADGSPVEAAQRFAASKQLHLPEDKEAIDNYSDAKWVLGGWEPPK